MPQLANGRGGSSIPDIWLQSHHYSILFRSILEGKRKADLEGGRAERMKQPRYRLFETLTHEMQERASVGEEEVFLYSPGIFRLAQ